jgi:glycosyltransferase involved in cell wall biosynthesis
LATAKICHVTSVSTLTARIFYRECIHTAELGYEVCLVRAGGTSETKNGVEVCGYRSGTGAISRLLASPFALRAALKQKADIYHLHTPQMLPIGWVLKVFFRKKVVYDIYEDFPSMALTKEKLPMPIRKALGALLFGVESASCRLFDGIVTADPSVMRMYARAASGPRIVFYNLPSLRLFAAAAQNGHPKIYDVVYSGGISERTGIYVLLDAIKQLTVTGLRPKVLIFGYFDDGASSAKLQAHISELQLDELVEIRGRVTPPEVPILLSQARIGVVPLQPIPKFLKNIPTKLFDYWACGLATVVSDLPPVRPFVGNNRFGFSYNPGAPQELAQALAWLIKNPERTHAMGQEARQAVLKRLNTDCERKRLGDFYERVMGNTYTTEYARVAA